MLLSSVFVFQNLNNNNAKHSRKGENITADEVIEKLSKIKDDWNSFYEFICKLKQFCEICKIFFFNLMIYIFNTFYYFLYFIIKQCRITTFKLKFYLFKN